MTSTQIQIIDLMATLALEECRELIEHIYDVNLFGGGFYDRMNRGQRAELEESIAQADRGDVVPSSQVFDEIARRFGLTRA